uniref:BHLH domain-containing protein n=1 Tax=Strongyloides stercoralis TaxID=6248 RepID=A0A0K0ESK4_STRER
MADNEIVSAMSPSVRPYYDKKRISHALRLLTECLRSQRQSKKKISFIVLLFIYCEVHPKRLVTTGAFGMLRLYMRTFKKKADSRAKYIYKCWKPGCKEFMKENNVDYYGKPIKDHDVNEE